VEPPISRPTPLVLALAVTACTATPPAAPAPVDPRPAHAWLAQFHGGFVLDCALPDLSPAAQLDTELAGPTSVVDGSIVRVVPDPIGIGLLRDGDRLDFVRWEIALAGTTCVRVPATASPVRGRLLDAARSPVPGVRVRGCGLDVTTGDDGAFEGSLAPEVGGWWGQSHARCLVQADTPDGTAARAVVLDEDRPASLRLQVGPTPTAPPRPTAFGKVPSLDAIPEPLRGVLASAAQPRPEPPVALLPELMKEPRGYTPTAYLTADLRAALRPGRTWFFRLWDEGIGTRELRWTVSRVEGMDIHIVAQEFPEGGGEPTAPSEQTWNERVLRGDSQFPRSLAKVSEGTWEVDGQPTPVWIYDVVSQETGEPIQRRIFRRAPPGLAVHATFTPSDRPPGSLDLLRIEDGAPPKTPAADAP
jgi:hypothetical protein